MLYSRFAEFAPEWLPQYVQELAARLTQPAELSIVGNLPGDVQAKLPALDAVAISQHGYVPRERLPELLGSGSMAVYPYRDSLITRSKQSVKLLELMAAGCPIVASDVGDVATTLGAAGLVLAGDHPAAFAAATAELLDQPERLPAMRAAGPHRITTCFTTERLAGELHALYTELGLPCSN
jgi:glycosyltransferase involved in cell wall biosynthesis